MLSLPVLLPSTIELLMNEECPPDDVGPIGEPLVHGLDEVPIRLEQILPIAMKLVFPPQRLRVVPELVDDEAEPVLLEHLRDMKSARGWEPKSLTCIKLSSHRRLEKKENRASCGYATHDRPCMTVVFSGRSTWGWYRGGDQDTTSTTTTLTSRAITAAPRSIHLGRNSVKISTSLPFLRGGDPRIQSASIEEVL
jgi:hypothetical protein